MKIKGQPGVGFSAIPRISSGMYIYMRDDDLYVRKRPDQPYKTDYCSRFYRAQMQMSAAMIGYAISEEIEGSHNWQIGSNDTWKDALTRAQFGTLFMITLMDGTVFHPADHSCTIPAPEEEREMPWEIVKQWSFAVDGAIQNVDYQLEDPYTEFIVMWDRVTTTVGGSARQLLVSTDNGASYWNSSGNYRTSDNVASQGPAVAYLAPQTAAASQTTHFIWLPAPRLGLKMAFALTPIAFYCLNWFDANDLPITNFRVRCTLGQMNGGKVTILGK